MAEVFIVSGRSGIMSMKSRNSYLKISNLDYPYYKIGDALELIKEIPDESIDLILTDPPYNEVDMKWDNFKEWNKLFYEINRTMNPYASFYIFGNQPFLANLLKDLNNYFKFRFELIWFKNAPAPHSSDYQPLRQHENIWCFTKKALKVKEGMIFNIDAVKTIGQGYRKLVKSKVQRHRGFKDFLCENEGRYPISVIYAQAVRGGHPEYTGHNTQKPLDLIEWIIKVASNKNDIILDPFLGSGTTLVACKKLNRKGIGFEINSEYEKIIRKRIKASIPSIETY
jgi:site-specific DNA-methyltransferase (adenine-specific)